MKCCSVEGCGKPHLALGYCSAHYTRFRKYGDPLTLKQKQLHGLTLMQRWGAYVVKSSGCWEWSGYRDPNGYGRLNIKDVPVLAHRISWELHHGPITTEQHVLHKCDNPPCVRPEHLFLGDQVANTADKMSKKRHRYGVSRGEAHGCSKLTAEQVIEIRGSDETSLEVAARLGISRHYVYQIRARQIWKHI